MNRKLIHQISLDAWAAGAALLAVFLLAETAIRGLVSMFFEMDWLILFVLAAAALALLTHEKGGDKAGEESVYGSGYWLAAVFGALAALTAWIKLPEGLSLFWRVSASAGVFLAAVLSRPLFRHD